MSLNESEEEIIVYAEFEDTVNIEHYSSLHVLGITEKKPIIQMDDTIFTGQLEYPLGTYMFFEKDPLAKSTDPLFDKLPKENVKLLCTTNKFLNMRHAYVTPRDGTEQNLPSQSTPVEDEIIPKSFNSIQEAIDHFKKEWESKLQDVDFKTVLSNSNSSDQEMLNIDDNS